MMLFKRKHQLGKNKVWGFTCILFLFVVNLYAITNPVEIYKNNKKQILEKKNITLDGFCFSVGFCYPKTITASSRNGAIRKSSFLATSNIYKIIMDKIEWPESISAQLKNSIFEEYIKLSDIHISLLKLQTVDTGRIGKEYYTVKAVPEDNIKTPTISYQDIYNTIEKAYKDHDKRLKNSIYLEICPKNQISQVINSIASNSTYGKNTKAVIINQKVPLFPDANSIKKINISILQKLKIQELITLLEVAPYYPILCWEIGNKLFNSGLIRNSEIFYTAGTKWPIDRKYNDLCRNKVNLDYFKSREGKIRSSGWVIILDFIKTKKRQLNNILNSNSLLIVDSLGTIPVLNGENTQDYYDGVGKYNESDLNKALELFVNSINKGVTSDNCNMIGNCLFYLNHKELSLPFFLQALDINPQHKDSLIHTAFIYDYLGKTDEAKKYALRAKKTGELPNWCKKEITKILNG